MIKVEIIIEDVGKAANVKVSPMVLKDKKPTPLEVAAWQEMRGRIFAKVVKVPAAKQGKK